MTLKIKVKIKVRIVLIKVRRTVQVSPKIKFMVKYKVKFVRFSFTFQLILTLIFIVKNLLQHPFLRCNSPTFFLIFLTNLIFSASPLIFQSFKSSSFVSKRNNQSNHCSWSINEIFFSNKMRNFRRRKFLITMRTDKILTKLSSLYN